MVQCVGEQCDSVHCVIAALPGHFIYFSEKNTDFLDQDPQLSTLFENENLLPSMLKVNTILFEGECTILKYSA